MDHPREEAAQEVEKEKREPPHPVLDVVPQDEEKEDAGGKRQQSPVQEDRDERRGKKAPGDPRSGRQPGKTSRQRWSPSPDPGEGVDPDRKPDQEARHDGQRG